MLVQCPNCHTTYRVADNLVAAPNPTFRCSRCRHIFVLGLKSGSAPAHKPSEPQPSPAREEEERELNFSSPPAEAKKTGRRSAEEIAGPRMEDEAPAPSAVEEPPSFTIPKRQKSWSMTPDHPASEEPVSMKEEKPFSQTDRSAERRIDFESGRKDSLAPQDKPDSEGPVEPLLDRPTSITPYLILCAALLFLFSAFVLVHKTRPESVEGLLKTIPWLGASVAQNSHLRQGVVLQTGQSSFQRISGNREIFVVSGVALNRNSVKVREVRVEGSVFGSDGKIIERQIVTVGNAMSTKIIRDLTALEISTLQRLSPPKRFELSPDEPVAFVIVFLKSSAEIKSFSFRVLSVEET